MPRWKARQPAASILTLTRARAHTHKHTHTRAVGQTEQLRRDLPACFLLLARNLSSPLCLADLRYAYVSNATYSYGKRDLFIWQQRPIRMSIS